MKEKTINKIAVVTGANSGIGKEAVKDLLSYGFKVMMICRDSVKTENTFNEFKKHFGNNIKLIKADLSVKNDIEKAGEELLNTEKHIDILINNAGVYKVEQELNNEGIEMNMAVNYFAMARLTNILLPLLKASEQGRIINLTSELFKKGNINDSLPLSYKSYNAKQAYNNSKLAVVLYTQKLSQILNNTNVTVNCVHPGVIATEIFRDYKGFIINLFMKILPKPDKAVAVIRNLAINPELSIITGKYFYKQEMNNIPNKFTKLNLLKKIEEETKKYL